MLVCGRGEDAAGQLAGVLGQGAGACLPEIVLDGALGSQQGSGSVALRGNAGKR